MLCLVVTVSGIIGLTYASVLYVVVFPSYEYYFHTFIGMFHFALVNMLLGMVVYSYRNIVKTGPGKIPQRWAPDGFTEEELEEAKQSSSSNEKYRKRFSDHHIVRFCRKCNSFKPPRAHHCSECDVCVPKMDHHCPWVNNCVGNNNHKLFILFLFWGVIGITYAMITLLSRLFFLFLDVINEREITMTPIKGVVIAVNVCILVPIILGMTSLFFWQLNLAITNTTTIEYHEKRWAIKEAKKKNIKYQWPYDFGPRENLKLFFGKSYLTWLLPLPSEYLSDGILYPSSIEMKRLSLYDEDYDKDKEKNQNEENEVIFDV